MHTLSYTPSDDQWYTDIGDTSHMTANGGNLTSYFNMSNNIIVGSGHNILIIGLGNALVPNSHHPLPLNNVLHPPQLIKNLVYIKKFTIDNDIYVKFDLFCFSVMGF